MTLPLVFACLALQVNPINLRIAITTTKSQRSHEINYKMEIEGFVGSDKFFNYHHGPSDCKFIQTKHDLAILIYGPVAVALSLGQPPLAATLASFVVSLHGLLFWLFLMQRQQLSIYGGALESNEWILCRLYRRVVVSMRTSAVDHANGNWSAGYLLPLPIFSTTSPLPG